MDALEIKTSTPQHDVVADGVIIIPRDSYIENAFK